VNRFVSLSILVCLTACGGSSTPGGTGTGTPTAPTPTPNRSPTITQLTVAPTSGVSQLSSFSMQAAATDPDGDTVTYQWEFGDGTTASGSSVAAKVFSGAGVMSARLTVVDGKGGTVSDSRDLVIGSTTGSWIATIQDFSRLSLDLQQSGAVVTGRFTQMDPLSNTPQGTSGITDPAEPGKIDKDGKFEIRLKVGRFTDFYMRGTMDGTGRTVTGGVFGSGFTGSPFSMAKQ